MKRHPSAQRFHDLLAEIGRLHDKKQQDYGKADDPFANVRASKEWDVPPWAYAMLRVSEKCRRLQAMRRNGKLANESAEDSFRDIAVYALIAEVLFEEAQNEGRRTQATIGGYNNYFSESSPDIAVAIKEFDSFKTLSELAAEMGPKEHAKLTKLAEAINGKRRNGGAGKTQRHGTRNRRAR